MHVQANATVAARPQTSGQDLLRDLKEAHDQLLAELSVMDRLTAGPLPDVSLYATTRWRLNRTSRNRRKVIEQAVEKLAARASAGDLAVISKFRSDHPAAVRQSSEHIFHWSLDAVKQNWAEYCQASNLLRAAMRNRIREEQNALYPILGRY